MKKRIYVIDGNDDKFKKHLNKEVRDSVCIDRKEYYHMSDIESREKANEIMNWIIYQIDKSDFLVVNLSNGYSLNELTMYEIMYAHEYAKNIFVICDSLQKVIRRKTNPVVILGIPTKTFNTFKECTDYINDYL